MIYILNKGEAPHKQNVPSKLGIISDILKDQSAMKQLKSYKELHYEKT